MRFFLCILGCITVFFPVQVHGKEDLARISRHDEPGEDLSCASSFSMPTFFLSNMGLSKSGRQLVQDTTVIAFAQTERGRVMFTPRGAYFGIQTGRNTESEGVRSKRDPSGDGAFSRITVMHTGFESKACEITPVFREKMSGKVNFFYGERGNWRSGLSMYRELAYEAVWPGIDLVFLGNGTQLEYRLDVSPGADPDSIQMETGAEQLELDADGNLKAILADGILTITTPYAFQMIHGVKRSVAVSFVPGIDGTYGFELGTYNPNYKLTIDPALIWGSYLNGSITGNDYVRVDDVAITDLDRVVVVGRTSSNIFPATQGAYQTTFNGLVGTTFALTFNATADTILNATFLGSSTGNTPTKVALGADGSVYLTGSTQDQFFPMESGFDHSFNGGTDAYISKLSSNLSQLLYSSYIGGTGSDYGLDLAVDGDFVTVVGKTSGDTSGFPLQGEFDGTDRSDTDGFITKIDTSATAIASLVYSSFLGGSGTDEITSVVLAANGDPMVCGVTSSSDFPTFNGYDSTPNGGTDVFYARLSFGLNLSLNYASYFGGSGDDTASQIVRNADDSFHVCGATESADLPLEGAYDSTHNGFQDAFIFKIHFLGATLEYATYYGGDNNDSATSLAVSSSGNMFLSGETWSDDLPVNGFAGDSLGHNADGFVAKINGDGTTLVYATYLGGKHNDEIAASALMSGGQLWVVGYTSSPDFPVTTGAYQEVSQAGEGGFATALSVSGNSVLASTYLAVSGGEDQAHAIAVTPSGKPVVLGETNDSTFPTAAGTYQEDLNMGTDLFITKFKKDGTDILFSTFLGGSKADIAGDIAIGPDSSIHFTGKTLSDDFPTHNGFSSCESNLQGDAFYTKLSSDGTTLMYGTCIGGLHGDAGTAIAVDSDGYTYIGGDTESTNFPRVSAFDASSDGDDSFITKIDSTSTSQELMFSSYLGGNGVEHLVEIVVGESSVFLLGDTDASDFPAQSAYSSTLQGGRDMFLCELPHNGSALSWATFFGGSNDESAGGLALSPDQTILVAGSTDSLDLPLSDAYMAANPSTSDDAVFISRFSADGTSLLYSTYFGGSNNQDCSGIASDSYGNFFLAGDSNSSDFPITTGSGGTSVRKVYVSKFSPDGQNLLYSSREGIGGTDELTDIDVSSDSHLFISGYNTGPGSPVTSGAYDAVYESYDGFVAKYELGLTISAHPEGDQICVGGGKILSVTASADSPLTYQWEQDGQVLTESSPYAGTQTSTLLIHDAELFVNGMFRCVVTSDLGSLASQETEMIVDELLVQITGDHAQGWDLVVLEAIPDCDSGPLTFDWENTTLGIPFGGGNNPVTLPVILAETSDFQVEILDQGASATATWRVLVAQDTRFFDLTGDDCNDINDLHAALEEWLTQTTQDADGTGWMDIRDFLYINLSGCP